MHPSKSVLGDQKLEVHHARMLVIFWQGGGVVDALLSQGKFQVRAISRDPSSDKAKALAQRGVEVVQADLNDKVSLVKVGRLAPLG